MVFQYCAVKRLLIIEGNHTFDLWGTGFVLETSKAFIFTSINTHCHGAERGSHRLSFSVFVFIRFLSFIYTVSWELSSSAALKGNCVLVPPASCLSL